jgi:hypothetical protein
MNSELLLIIIILFLLFIFLFPRKDKRYRNDRTEEIKFPFRAIEKEKPTQIILQVQSPPEQKQPIQNQVPSQPIQNQVYQANPNHVKEIYPVPFVRGDEYKKNYMSRGTIGLRDMDRPFQDITTEFIRVGTVYSENSQDDTVMTLYRRDISPERDLYEYKVVDKTNGNDIELFLSTNVNFLRNGDKIMIPGYENKGNFIVNLDSRYRYTMFRPFY